MNLQGPPTTPLSFNLLPQVMERSLKFQRDNAEAIRANHLPTEHILCCGDSITYDAHMNGQGTTMGENYPAFLRSFIFAP